jgi:glycosyltransferase involved in cell wall biosynthesis
MRYEKIACIVNKSGLDVYRTIEYFSEFSLDFYLYIFPNSKINNPAIFRHYHQGILKKEKECCLYKGKNKIIIYILQFIYYLYFLKKFKIKKTYIVVVDLQFLFFNSIIRLFNKNKLVFWIGDAFPNRYESLLIYLVDSLGRFYMNNLEHVFFSSPNLKKLYLNNYASNKEKKVITLGIKNLLLNRNPELNLFGFIGYLRKGQGIELIFEVLKKNKKFVFEIIGDGEYKNDLEELTKKYNIQKQVKFFGYLDYKKLIDISSRWKIALAPYFPSKDNYTYYADPGKIKLYLELELPIIMTRITYIAQEIETQMAGEIVTYDPINISDAIKKIQNNYDIYSNGVKKLKNNYFYKKVFQDGFQSLEQQI